MSDHNKHDKSDKNRPRTDFSKMGLPTEVVDPRVFDTPSMPVHKIKTGIELINEERERQIKVEGWGLDHDDDHDEGELYQAASAYWNEDKDLWPFEGDWFRLSDPIRNKVKAGALLQAEIDRLTRLKLKISERIDQELAKKTIK